MKFRPILFSTPMVLALLEGRKTQTRRILKLKHLDQSTCGAIHPDGSGKGWIAWSPGTNITTEMTKEQYPELAGFLCPYGSVGDVLIVSKSLEGYDCEYCADGEGNIWSKATGQWKLLKSGAATGYRRLTLRQNGKDVNRTVHSVVCAAWHEKPELDRPICIRHLDGDAMNNAPDNLSWGNYTENWDDRKAHNRGIHEKHQASKLTMAIAEEMRASGKNASQLSRVYNVNPKTVERVLRKQTWVEYDTYIEKPKSACRIFLEITGVRVEHLKDITPDDCRAEGIERWTEERMVSKPTHYKLYFSEKGDDSLYSSQAYDSFESLWKMINGPESWEVNPFVWVLEFKRIDKPEGFA